MYERRVGMSTSVVSCIQLYMYTCVGYEHCVYSPQCYSVVENLQEVYSGFESHHIHVARHFFFSGKG